MERTNEMSKKRKSEISLMNVIFCLLVIFIHIISYAVAAFVPGTLKYTAALLLQRGVSFVVQGFVLLSGVKLFLTHKDGIPYGKYLILRLKSILIPYAFSFLLYYVFYVINYDYPVDALEILKHFFTGDLVCHLYFIPLILQFDILFPLWKRLINNCSAVIVIPFVILISQLFGIYMPFMVGIFSDSAIAMYNDRFFVTYLAFYVIGCYIGKNYDRFVQLMKSDFKTVCFCFLISLLLFGVYTYIAFNAVAQVVFIDLIHWFYCLCAVIFVYAVSVKISPRLVRKWNLIKQIDASSFYIYLYHMIVLFGADFVVMKLEIMSQISAFLIRCIIVYGITVPVCICYNIIKRKKCFVRISTGG